VMAAREHLVRTREVSLAGSVLIWIDLRKEMAARSSGRGTILTWLDFALNCALQSGHQVHLEIVHLLQEIRVHYLHVSILVPLLALEDWSYPGLGTAHGSRM
jgi:hypothetical protein